MSDSESCGSVAVPPIGAAALLILDALRLDFDSNEDASQAKLAGKDPRRLLPDSDAIRLCHCGRWACSQSGTEVG